MPRVDNPLHQLNNQFIATQTRFDTPQLRLLIRCHGHPAVIYTGIHPYRRYTNLDDYACKPETSEFAEPSQLSIPTISIRNAALFPQCGVFPTSLQTVYTP
jgi:hypothetical protein